MSPDPDEVLSAIDEFGGFLAGFKDYLRENPEEFTAGSAVDTIIEEYHLQIEVLWGDEL
jgi:hypothetical protein